MNERQSLYDKIGGKDAVAGVVDKFYRKILADDRIRHFFEHTDIDALRRHQTMFIAYALGGPNYSGRSMEKAHEGLNLQEVHWDAVVEHLVSSLQESGVSDPDIGTIAEQLMPLKPHILHQ